MSGQVAVRSIAGASSANWAERGAGVATFTALLSFLLASGYDFPGAARNAALGAILVLLAASDLRRRVIPNQVVYSALVLVIVTAPLRPEGVGSILVGMLLATAPMAAMFIVAPGSVGGGDVKMAALVGAVTAYPEVLAALTVAGATGGIVAALLAIRMGRRCDSLPYGPFLMIGALASLLATPP